MPNPFLGLTEAPNGIFWNMCSKDNDARFQAAKITDTSSVGCRRTKVTRSSKKITNIFTNAPNWSAQIIPNVLFTSLKTASILQVIIPPSTIQAMKTATHGATVSFTTATEDSPSAAAKGVNQSALISGLTFDGCPDPIKSPGMVVDHVLE